MATTRHEVTPIVDIQSAAFGHQYQLGAYWARYGDEQSNGPQSDRYLIENMTKLLQSGQMTALQNDRFPHLGFYLGMAHGGVLNPQTGELQLHLTNLVTLSDPNFARGYRAGRVWFFYEADPDERRLTDASLVQRIHELATERHEYRDEESTVNFALGCLLGELSGQLFPLTHDEHERIQRKDRQFLAEDEAQRAEMSQERKTEPLDTTVLQEA